MRTAVLFSILLLCPAAALGEDLCSNRPGLATDTCVLPPRVVQLETSLVDWSAASAGGERTRQLTLGATMVRLGIGRSSELQLAWAPWTRVRFRGDGGGRTVSGVGDAQFGFKALLVEGLVAVAVAPFVNLPLARRELGSGEIEGGIMVPIDFALAAGWSLTLTPELDWNADSDARGHHLAPAIAASIGRSIGKDLSLALDALLVRDLDPGGRSTSAVAGLSLAWQARPNLQLDVEAGTRLLGEMPDLTLIAGFVYRP